MKFEIGDRVRVRKNIDYVNNSVYRSCAGKTGILRQETSVGNYFRITFDDKVLNDKASICIWFPHELELIPNSVNYIRDLK